MKKIVFAALMLLLTNYSFAQNKYFTRSGNISFFSETPVENIDAKNNQINSIIDFDKSELVFAALMKSFVFPKALMQEHFNENYVESDKFPKATFKGKIKEKVDPKKDGNYKVNVDGDLTIHGVTKQVSFPALLEIKGGKIHATSKFDVIPKDYNITIPALVKDKIAKQISVTVDSTLEPYKSN